MRTRFALRPAGAFDSGADTNRDNKVVRVCVNMGQPILQGLANSCGSRNRPGCRRSPLQVAGQELSMTCIPMGNPHAVFFCEDLDAIDLSVVGPLIEHPLFLSGSMCILSRPTVQEFTMRAWERGSGITLACGTRSLLPVRLRTL